MEFFIHPFLTTNDFLNVNLALEDPNFGRNKDVLILGAHCGIDPIDLLDLIHDKDNGLSQTKIMHLLKIGVTSIPYLLHFTRLSDELGYEINEIKLLMQEKVDPETIFFYDQEILYQLPYFGDSFRNRINRYINLNIRPTTVISLVEAGFPIESTPSGFWDFFVPEIAKANLPLLEAVSFLSIDIKATEISSANSHILDEVLSLPSNVVKAPCSIIEFMKAGITAEEVSSFLLIGVNSPILIIEMIKSGITPEDISSFLDIGLSPLLSYMYLEKGITAQVVSSFLNIGVKSGEVKAYITAGITAKQVVPYLQIGPPNWSIPQEYIICCIVNDITPELAWAAIRKFLFVQLDSMNSL
jgi:hypothetical protein